MGLKARLIKRIARDSDPFKTERLIKMLLALDDEEPSAEPEGPVNDPEFESKHPRGPGGQFASGGGGTQSSASTPTFQSHLSRPKPHPVVQSTENEIAEFESGRKTATPEDFDRIESQLNALVEKATARQQTKVASRNMTRQSMGTTKSGVPYEQQQEYTAETPYTYEELRSETRMENYERGPSEDPQRGDFEAYLKGRK